MNISTKIFLSLILLFTFGGQTKAEDVNDWILEQLNGSINFRHVNYEEMYTKIMDNSAKIARILSAMTFAEYCNAYALDSNTVNIIDIILEKYTDEELKGNNVSYLLDKKYYLMVMQNRYDEIERMACYIDSRWQRDPVMAKKAACWHQVAKEGKGIRPVSIRREKNVVRLAPDTSNGYMMINAVVNQKKDTRFMIDTGMMSSTILSRKLANQINVHMLPDSVFFNNAINPDATYSRQLGIVDSLHIEGITFYNLPVWVYDEVKEYECDGIIGSPDLTRLEYMELSPDSIIFRYPVPEGDKTPNFTMGAGIKGERCICLPYIIDGHKSSFILDTGSDSFMFPPQYTGRKEGFFMEIGKMKVWVEGKFKPHDFASHKDSHGILGRPILKSFERLCLNFRDAHVDYILKPDVNHTEYHYDGAQLK
jgi:predicted aspartyl protease